MGGAETGRGGSGAGAETGALTAAGFVTPGLAGGALGLSAAALAAATASFSRSTSCFDLTKTLEGMTTLEEAEAVSTEVASGGVAFYWAAGELLTEHGSVDIINCAGNRLHIRGDDFSLLQERHHFLVIQAKFLGQFVDANTHAVGKRRRIF
jgi:hypothetical protein